MRNVVPIPLAPTVEPRDDPPPELTPESYAERLYLALAPLALRDAEVDWALLILCNAIGGMFQETEDIARDAPEGPGWSALMDLARCPERALPWLGQFVGVRLLPGSSVADQRARIASTDGFSRGTPEAIRAAAQATLTGAQRVYLRERDGGDPYALQVRTEVGDTPDPTATHNAILAQKPGGIVLSFSTVVNWDWQQVTIEEATWRTLNTNYATWREVVEHEPGT